MTPRAPTPLLWITALSMLCLLVTSLGVTETVIPQTVNPPPSQHNVVFLPSTPTRPQRPGTNGTPGSPNKESCPSSSRHGKGRASQATDTRLWAVHTRRFIGVASTSKADKLIATATKQGKRLHGFQGLQRDRGSGVVGPTRAHL
ncbi:hypothetical protein BT96DRAFT_947660 [Gymnopus androsaceus JB14]|uniref:Uncharacterized protein n=1 Tax=Gymnopus androsaceus JB14 TaxID=1447944 RepID=A0A6A4GRH1_9AGAR|nr:hypothetical protein BT96DRAFT_947660 [Gymnopus androsaceus JB14]